MSAEYDAIVVGAGFAGVTAARELTARGRRTLLLEARDRLGGRTWTDSLAGQSVELGGAWVHWFQPHVWAEVTRYAIPVVEDDLPERWIVPSADGLCSYGIEEAFARLGELFAAVFEGAREYLDRPYDPLLREVALRKVDRLSLRDRFDELELSAEDECWLDGLLASAPGAPTWEGAFTMAARSWALSGWSFETFWDCRASYRLGPGTIRLLEAMVADASPDVRLGAPVASIDDDGERVHVSTRAGERYSAPVAVVAVPANVWPSIEFTPALPAAHRAVSVPGAVPACGSKILIHARGDLGRFCAQVPEGYPITTLSTYAALEDGQLMFGFTAEPSLELEQIAAAVGKVVPEAEVVAAKGHDWVGDEFSRGGWSFAAPGHLTEHLRALQQPHGRVVFATSDIASGWAGFIDGAVESGLRAAALATSRTLDRLQAIG